MSCARFLISPVDPMLTTSFFLHLFFQLPSHEMSLLFGHTFSLSPEGGLFIVLSSSFLCLFFSYFVVW